MKRTLGVLLLLVLTTLWTTGSASLAAVRAAAPSTVHLPALARNPTANPAAVPFFAYYYLWWSLDHWTEKLGAGYPLDGSWPLPGQLDPTTGCGSTPSFPGSTISDVPSAGIYSQPTSIAPDQLMSSIYATHVRQAAAAGLTGFLAGWRGTGLPGQALPDTGYNKRLDLLVQVVRNYNLTASQRFQYIIDYETFSETKTPAQITADLDYLLGKYGDDAGWARRDGKRMLQWSNSRNYPTATLQAIAQRYGQRLFIIGDERSTTWTSERARYLDGTGHYWSSQDPFRNPQSFKQEQAFAAQVHADGRQWFAPLAPGYNDELTEIAQGTPVVPGDCVARRGADTLRALYAGNRATDPQGWFVISWNEWVEHTYIEPSKRYGSLYLDTLGELIAAQR